MMDGKSEGFRLATQADHEWTKYLRFAGFSIGTKPLSSVIVQEVILCFDSLLGFENRAQD